MKKLEAILWTEGKVVRIGDHGIFKGPLSNNEAEGVVMQILETENFGALIVRIEGGQRILLAW